VHAPAADEFRDVLVTASREVNYNFNLDELAQDVSDAQGAKTRSFIDISERRLEKFDVHERRVYKKLAQDIAKMKEYPAKPPASSTAQVKATWRTNCANFHA